MSEAIALAEGIADRELQVERHGAATGDVRRTRADVAQGGAGARLAPDDAARRRSARPVGLGRC